MVSLPNYVSYDLTAAIPVRGLEKGEEKKKKKKSEVLNSQIKSFPGLAPGWSEW